MKVSKEQAAANRAQVVAVAGRLLRERGIDGIGVDALMQGAGLTHGGFYKSFASKDALVAEACEHALSESAARWDATVDSAPEDALAAFLERYLSSQHCEAIGEGCIYAALAADVGKRRGPIRAVFTQGLRDSIARLSRAMPNRSLAARRDRALITMASLVGAVVLARAVEDGELRDDILAATAKALKSGGRSDPRRQSRRGRCASANPRPSPRTPAPAPR